MNGEATNGQVRFPVTIRLALPEDAPAICMVLDRSVREVCAPDYGHDENILALWTSKHLPGHIVSMMIDPDAVMLVASDALRRVVGVGSLSKSGEIRAVYVLPEALHRGIGKAMLLRLENEARAVGLREIWLNSSITARQFYLRNGYHPSGDPLLLLGAIRAYPLRKKLT